ncbi:CotH kinase family protein [Crenothrix sp.]|uniref:CotH kinase family protein n=1 Tax=Crenothrix sp. TaxID=3100433 RepID=UPI00374D667C
MGKKLGSCLILGLAINTLLFSGSALSAVNPVRFNIRLNDIGIGVDGTDVNNRRLFVSLGTGFSTAKAFDPTVKFDNPGTYSIECGGVKIKKSGDICHFKPVKYGDSTQVIKVYKGSATTPVDTYTVVFSNLPIAQITTDAAIVNTPKVRGDFRLMSGEFNQDITSPMGIEFRGQTTQEFPKKSYGFQLGTAAKSTKVKLLDLAEGDDWILDASYADNTFARNNIGMDIFNEIHPNKDKSRANGQNAIKGRLAEAIVNGKYAGIYILNQHVGPTLLGLKLEKGSVIYKADFAQWKTDLFFPYKKGDIEFNFSQVYPKTKADFTPLKSLIDFVVTSAQFPFTDNIENRIDLTSLADWYLLTRVTQASDNSSKNFFLAKNAGGDFFIVPWDHNATFGMFWDGSKENTRTDFLTPDNNLIVKLLKYPESNFNAILQERWNVLKNTVFLKKNLLARFSKVKSQLVRGGALSREQATWKPTTVTTTIVVNKKPVKVSYKVPDYNLSTPTYIDKFLSVRIPAMNAYINSLPK